MTREQIEKAAIKFAKSYYLDKYGNMNAEITEDEFDALVCSIAYMFMYGAQWRINSVWHDNSIRPGEDCDVLVETKRGIEMDRYDIDYNELNNGTDWEADVIRWAYVDDLLPERKEETK